ncbi:MAG: cytochrome c4 [Gammaproteobacteria bacterium]|nr:cytochrome c4 [Gammaproteobacteria bacterium]MBU1414656.1 cytochrome c4 [Gammaproteobacteria bacterium]
MRYKRTVVASFRLGTTLCALLAPSASWAQGVPPLAERLQLCATCHNPDGNSTIPDNPRLAGQDAAYLARQLADFKNGSRPSPVMAGIVGLLADEELKPLAEFFSEQAPAGPTGAADDAAQAPGRQIFDEGILGSAVPACSGCHNDDGSGTEKYPRITGQHARYVVQQLMNFRSGVRANDGRAVMQAVAKRMNEQEIQAVAEYVATLKEEEEQ